jgi:YidC/Oxa1 family membrane protein insertase
MDKNTVTGLVLIGILLIGFSYFSRPSDEEQAAMQRYNDSITVVKQQEAALEAKKTAALANETQKVNTADSNSVFFQSANGSEQVTTIENNLIKLSVTNKGGYVNSVLLKNYKGQDKQPLVLFKENDATLNFNFYNKEEVIQSKDYYFQAVNQTDSTLTMRLAADSTSYIDFVYKLHNNSYMVDFSIQATGMQGKLANTNYVDIQWAQRARQLEKGFTYENRLSELTFKYSGDNSDYLSASKDEEKSVPERLDWIGYKNQFFSSVLIADKDFEKSVLRQK